MRAVGKGQHRLRAHVSCAAVTAHACIGMQTGLWARQLHEALLSCRHLHHICIGFLHATGDHVAATCRTVTCASSVCAPPPGCVTMMDTVTDWSVAAACDVSAEHVRRGTVGQCLCADEGGVGGSHGVCMLVSNASHGLADEMAFSGEKGNDSCAGWGSKYVGHKQRPKAAPPSA